MEADHAVPYDNLSHKWEGIDLNVRLEDVDCTCKGVLHPALKTILPVGINTHKVIVYNSCLSTLIAATKRQMRVVPKPDIPCAQVGNVNYRPIFTIEQTNNCICLSKKLGYVCNPKCTVCYEKETPFGEDYEPKPFYSKDTVIGQFQEYCLQIFNTEMDFLNDFDYSYNEWFNHLEAGKQKMIEKVDKNKLLSTDYGLFCKREKQALDDDVDWEVTDDKLPKNRAISSCPESVKEIMGPAIWAAEHYASNFIPGYSGHTNWQQLESYYAQWYKDGYRTVIQGDGSGFDGTQHYACKFIDRLIYSKLARDGKIHHVDPNIFQYVAMKRFRNIRPSYFKNGCKMDIGKARIDGTVFSGSPDTTFGNTLRMIMYIRFTLYKGGLEYDRDYKLLVKGDDFVIFSRVTMDYEKLFNKYWVRAAKNPKEYFSSFYGLGQILKFLKIETDYRSIDFCSTNVIQDREVFKIVRQPLRMDPLAHYSTKALHLDNKQLCLYYLALADSVDSWAKNLPFFTAYAEAYRKIAQQMQIKFKVKPTMTDRRKTLPKDGHQEVLVKFKMPKWKRSGFGSDFDYAANLRVSNTVVSEEAVYSYFLDRYQIMKYQIESHRSKIKGEQLMLYDDIA